MRTRFTTILLLSGGLLAIGTRSARGQVVDQKNLVNEDVLGTGWQGETFVPQATTAVGASFNLAARSLAVSGTLTVQLWSDVPSAAGASLLGSGITVYSLAASQQSYFDVFWSAVSVTPGTPYFLAMFADDPNTWATTSYNDAYSNGSPYLGIPWREHPCGGCDLNFKEYSASAVVSTPEPASLVLTSTGMLALLGIAIRRRKQNA